MSIYLIHNHLRIHDYLSEVIGSDSYVEIYWITLIGNLKSAK